MKLNRLSILAFGIATLALTGCSGNTEKAEAAPTDETIILDEAVETPEATPDSVATAEPEAAATEESSAATDGIERTASGLGVKILNPGTGSHPERNTPIVVHYKGMHTDGTVFDSSYDRGAPATFRPTQVIAGFGEGLMMLGKGGKAVLYIPSELGYGATGTPGGPIAPNEDLVFEVEIVDFAR